MRAGLCDGREDRGVSALAGILWDPTAARGVLMANRAWHRIKWYLNGRPDDVDYSLEVSRMPGAFDQLVVGDDPHMWVATKNAYHKGNPPYLAMVKIGFAGSAEEASAAGEKWVEWDIEKDCS